jgi:outer membrane lipopolysaccharide assembly protein LptE/RlpB
MRAADGGGEAKGKTTVGFNVSRFKFHVTAHMASSVGRTRETRNVKRLATTVNRQPTTGLSAVLLCSVLLTACGYHTTAHSVRLPQNVRTVAIPAFTNQTQSYRVEQILTSAVVREFVTRTKFRIINELTDEADATLHGTVLTTELAPLTYDSATGRASTALVTVTMRVSLVDRKGTVLFDNPNYTFREQYQVSRELSSFFEEDAPAMDRLSRELARTLVSNILEAY